MTKILIIIKLNFEGGSGSSFYDYRFFYLKYKSEAGIEL